MKEKTKPKKPTTKRIYKDEYLSLYSDAHNYIIEIGTKRFNYGSLRGLFYGILQKKLRGYINQKSFENVTEFKEIHEQAIAYVKNVAINMVDWK